MSTSASGTPLKTFYDILRNSVVPVHLISEIYCLSTLDDLIKISSERRHMDLLGYLELHRNEVHSAAVKLQGAHVRTDRCHFCGTQEPLDTHHFSRHLNNLKPVLVKKSECPLCTSWLAGFSAGVLTF